jgi:hypothetical protein
MTVTVVSCVYGDYPRFSGRWARAVGGLDPAPDAVVVASDTNLDIDGAWTIKSVCDWKHPQAYYLQLAITRATTDWVWIVDIDDIPYKDGLDGLEELADWVDVWQMGFDRSDGETYVPPALSPDEFLASDRNVYVGTSAIRTDIFHDCGGYPDVALQDWGLWRRLARHRAIVESSGRTHFRYVRHPDTRGENELTVDVRPDHLAEMMEAELAHA